MNPFLRIYATLLFIVASLANQMTEAYGSTLSFKGEHFTTIDGLPSNTIRTITQDSKGKMWFGTSNGIATYDGYGIHDLAWLNDGADRNIQTLVPDRFGNIWIVSSSGKITCIDTSSQQPREEVNSHIRSGIYGHVNLYPDSVVCLWGKEDGLMLIKMKNNPYRFTRIPISGKNEDSNTTLPEKCRVNFVINDANNIWIGTNQGLFLYSLTSDMLKTVNGGAKFISVAKFDNNLIFYSTDGYIYRSNGTRLKELGKIKNPIRDGEYKGNVIYEGNWFIFGKDRMACFDLANNKEAHPDNEYNVPELKITHDNVNDTYITGQSGNVIRIPSSLDTIHRIELPKNKSALNPMTSPNSRLRFFSTPDLIWIASNGEGLFAYDKNSSELIQWNRNTPNSKVREATPLVSDRLISVYYDRSGSLWIGYEKDGLSHLKISNNKWVEYMFPGDDLTSLGDNESFRMVSFLKDQLYAGNKISSVFRFSGNLSLYDSQRYPSNVYTMECDTTGTIWVGMKHAGLIVGDKSYKSDSYDTSSIGDNDVFDIFRDRKGRMWIGTLGGGLDLAVRDKNGDIVFDHFLDGNYRGRQIRTIAEDRNGLLWIGSSNGVAIIDPDEISLNPEQYTILNTEKGILDSNEIYCIYSSSSGDMYVAQKGMGVIRVRIPVQGDYTDLRISRYNRNNGLCSDMVQSFIEDNEGFIWISTEFGLSRLDPRTEKLDNYYPSSDMESNQFNESAAVKTSDGRLIFGSNRGLCIIDPRNLNQGIDSLRIEDVLLKVEGKNITARFFTYNYSMTAPIRFSFRISDNDEDWSVPSISNEVDVRNLSYGSHLIEVKAIGDDGIWSQVFTAEFTIPVPWYFSWWAIMIYVVCVGGIMYIVFKTTTDRLKLNEQIRMTTSLTEAQMYFFKEISEGFRTPLTIIKGKIEKLMADKAADSDAGDELTQMNHYAEQLISTMHSLTLIKTEFQKGHFILKQDLPVLHPENEYPNEESSIDIPDTEIPLNEQTVLIVEPDDALRTHLQHSLSKYFQVIGTASGEDVQELLKTRKIDIVISAAIMPDISGVDLLKKIRQSALTNHIPVILLTAYDTTENIVEGTEAGADAYLRKPFSTRVILATIVNLLNQRIRLRNRYSNDLALSEPKAFDNKEDLAFMTKFDKLIDARLADGVFSLDEVAAELGLGRTVFYKKVKLISNHTPNDYIRYRRMKRAAQLLSEGNHTVSEVSYMVGITDPMYFSRTFKKHFGVAPSNYLKSLRDNVSQNTSK